MDGGLGRRQEAGLETLHGAGGRIAGGVHRVQRRRLHRVVRVLRMLDGLRGDVRHLGRRLVRLCQRFAGDLLGRVGGFLRRLAHLLRGLRQVVPESGKAALDALERRIRHVARALLHLIERGLDVLPDLFRRFQRLRGPLGSFARRLQRPGSGVLDLVGDLLRLLRRTWPGPSPATRPS